MKKVLSFLLLCASIVILFTPVSAGAAAVSPKAGTAAVSSGYLNVRRSASTGSAVVGTLKKGAYVTLISQSGSWWKVEYGDGKYGYCHANYIAVASGSAAAVRISSGSLNVRKGAGTFYSRTGSLKKGETVIVLSVSGGWSRVLYHGTKTGWVSSNYLTVSAAEAYAALSLKVPDYKQTDSRWSGKYIGSSGKTIARIGCATTAIAMIESYRSGTAIYPDAMADKLSYTSSGSVYWPAGYTAVTDSSGYLSALYQQLKLGRPVLMGAKTSSGGQHWVVITGFTGGSALTADRFTINDPGSNSRRTLQQFLNAYPVFYKYFIYG